jgi:MFS family permease
VSFGSITLLVFADASLGYVLSNIGLQTDPNAPLYPTGSRAGQVVLYSEVLICATIWVWGMMSDRIGRRWVFVAGTLLIAISFVAMPFARTFAQVVIIRLIFAPGAAACSAMLMALICDYPRDDTHHRSRGKASAIMGILAGLGALFALFVLLRIPKWVSGGISSAGLRYMFFAAASVSLIGGIVSMFGLAKKSAVAQYQHVGIKEVVTSGIQVRAHFELSLSKFQCFFNFHNHLVLLVW